MKLRRKIESYFFESLMKICALIIVGILLLSLFFVLDGNLRWLGLLGVVLLLTAFVGWCPAYSVLGIATNPFGRKPIRRS